MGVWTRRGLGLMIALAAGWLALPGLVNALPGRYLVRLQSHPWTAAALNVIRPLPTALPAPTHQAPPPTIVLPTPLPTFTPTPAATPTPPAISLTATAIGPPTPTATATPIPSPTPLPVQQLLSGAPVVWQSFSNCGPANLSIALGYWGEAISQEIIAQQVRPNEEDRNVSPWEMRDYVNQHTRLRASAHSGGDIALLQTLLAAGIPVTVQRGYDVAEQGWFGHYLTLYGYDAAAQTFYSRDTSSGPFDGTPRLDTFEQLQRMWQQFNYNFVVVYPPDQEGLVQALLGATLTDPAAMWQHSAAQAQAEIAARPDDAFAWYNLGVNLTHLADLAGRPEDYTAAVSAFDQARQIGLPPRLPFYQHEIFRAYQMADRYDELLWLTTTMTTSVYGGWWVEEINWYHGLALLAQGDMAGARQTLERALRVNPFFEPAQTTLDSLPQD